MHMYAKSGIHGHAWRASAPTPINGLTQLCRRCLTLGRDGGAQASMKRGGRDYIAGPFGAGPGHSTNGLTHTCTVVQRKLSIDIFCTERCTCIGTRTKCCIDITCPPTINHIYIRRWLFSKSINALTGAPWASGHFIY